jgi:hypothetical protein
MGINLVDKNNDCVKNNFRKIELFQSDPGCVGCGKGERAGELHGAGQLLSSAPLPYVR